MTAFASRLPAARALCPVTFLATLLAICLAICLTFAPPAARAQTPSTTPAAQADESAVTAAQLSSAREAVASADVNDAQRKQATAALDAASTALEQAADWQAQAQKLRQAVTQPAASRANAVAAGAAWAEWRASVPDNASATTLEALLAQERSASTELRRRIEQRAAELAAVIAQPGQLSDTLSDLRRRLDALSQPVQADPAVPAAVQAAQALRRRAEAASLRAEMALYELQQDTAGSRQAAIEAELQALRQELTLREPRQAWLSQRIAQRSLQQLQQQAEQLQAQAQALDKPSPAATALAQSGAQLASQLVQDTVQLASEREQLGADERTSEQITTVLRDARTRLSVGGNSAANGQWLWQQRMATPATLTLQLQRRDVQARLAELRMRQYTLSDERQQAARQGRSTGDADTPDLPVLRAQQQRLMDQLAPLLAQRVAVLEQSDRLLASMVERASELRRLMSQQLLWVPSHPRIDTAWLAALPREFRQGDIGPRMAGIARLLWQDVLVHPLAHNLALLAVGVLFWLRRHARARLHTLAGRTRDVLQDRFAYTAQALGWGVVSALPWPAAVWCLGLLIQELGAGRVADAEALGQAMTHFAGLVLALALLRALIAHDGLAEAHLRWPAPRLRHLRRAWWAACGILLPAGFLGMWALLLETGSALGVQARLAVLLIATGMAALMAWLLRRESPFPSLPLPAQRLVRVLIPAAFAAVALMAAAGYVYSSAIVLNALLSSLVVILLVQVAYGLATRWMLLGERQLALRQWQAERAAPEVVDLESGERTPPDTAALELVEVGAQSRRLLSMARLALLLTGLALAWSDVLPALLRLEGISLWQFSDKSAAGESIISTVTAADVLMAALLLTVGLSLARNIPGLVELLLSSRIAVAPATRYTISTLLRYGVTIACTLIALSLLGMRWSQLQWMAAALTVGLGFGLQEIFANFVSGLILLVERPFRVGDTITIGNVSGSVTQIYTRATVVQDFDRKEVIIPNKTFITGQVINWTLSDAITRLVVPVGVAYGSPVPRVHALLQQAAREVPGVLAEPVPRSWLMAFGASTLDFELRVFVPSMGERLLVQNALLQRINELLSAEGIEIAFPQMDVHVRDWPARPAAAGPGASMAKP
ncbi:MAG: mechanosensitive ion channel [Pseudomonadota bacterium]|nr:mechanosensitive ion channel [Pseudomonadota bacterium]